MRQIALWDVDNRPEAYQDTAPARKMLEDSAPLGDQAITDAEYAAMQDDARLDWLEYVRDDYAQNMHTAEIARHIARALTGHSAVWWHGMADELFDWCANERARAVEAAVAAQKEKVA